jgi:hypothetical protein
MGYTHPTPVQHAIFDPAVRGADLVVQARRSCEQVRATEVVEVPIVGLAWLCTPGRAPRLAGSLPGGAKGAFTASNLVVSDDLRVLGLHIVGFANVGGQIIKLHRRQALLLRRYIARLAPAAGPGAEFELPVALPNRKTSLNGMMDEGLTQGLVRFPEQCGQDADAVLARSGGEPCAEQIRARRQEVAQADELTAF